MRAQGWIWYWLCRKLTHIHVGSSATAVDQGEGARERGRKGSRAGNSVMRTRTLIIGTAAVALVGFAVYKTGPWAWRGAEAQAPAAARIVPVEVATAVRRPAPVFLEALGNVTPIETVAVRSRVDSEIAAV